jgi:hypothetical protein
MISSSREEWLHFGARACRSWVSAVRWSDLAADGATVTREVGRMAVQYVDQAASL